MDRKPLGQSQIPSKIPGVGLKSKIPGPTPNKGILKKGVKRDSDQISDQKENVQITAPKPLAKKVFFDIFRHLSPYLIQKRSFHNFSLY